MDVQFVAEEQNARVLEELGIQLESPSSEAVNEAARAESVQSDAQKECFLQIPSSGKIKNVELICTSRRIVKTEKLRLIWALSGSNSTTYVVLPFCEPSACPVEFDKSLVEGLNIMNPNPERLPNSEGNP